MPRTRKLPSESEHVAVRGIIQSACAVYLRKIVAERGGCRRQVDAAKKLGYDHSKWDVQIRYLDGAESVIAELVSLAEKPGWCQAVLEDLRAVNAPEE